MKDHLRSKGEIKKNLDLVQNKKAKRHTESLDFANEKSGKVPKPQQLAHYFHPRSKAYKLKNPEYVKTIEVKCTDLMPGLHSKTNWKAVTEQTLGIST